MSNNNNSLENDEIKDNNEINDVTCSVKKRIPMVVMTDMKVETSPETPNACSYLVTKNKYTLQAWATCYDCFRTTSQGACLFCLESCHKGHNIGKVNTTNFFCDCMCSEKEARPEISVFRLG